MATKKELAETLAKKSEVKKTAEFIKLAMLTITKMVL